MRPTVTVCDVAARDGLQNDPTILAPETRAELVDRLAAAGLPRIEAVSFVNPARVPQMAGAEEVVSAIDPREGVVYAGLVLNEKGYDRLRETSLGEVHSAFAATETFNQRNSNASVRGLSGGLEASRRAGPCRRSPRHGDDRRVVRLSRSRAGWIPGGCSRSPRELAEAGADEVGFADTIGVAVPSMVKSLVERGGATARTGRCSPAQHAQHRDRERIGGGRGGRHGHRRLRGRYRRLPVRSARDGKHLHRGPRLHAPRRGRGDRDRPRRADRGRDVARRGPRASARGHGLPCRHVRCGRRLAGLRGEDKANGVQARRGRGRHVHRPLPRLRRGSRAVPGEDPVDPGRPVRGRADGRAADLRRGGNRRPRHSQHPPRHHRGHERGARVEGSPRRPDHHRGLQADPPPGALADPGPARGLDHHDQARSARAPLGHARGGRAHGRARRHGRAGRRAAGGRDRPGPRRVGCRVADRRARQLLRLVAARGGDRCDRRAPVPGLPGHALLARPARVPRVRADADGVHELVREAARGDLHGAAAALAQGDRRCGGGEHPALGRRPDDDARGDAQPDLRSPVRPVRRCRGRSVRRPQGWVRQHPHVRHGRHVDGRGAVRERPADDRPRDDSRALPDQGAVRLRAHGRRRRRLDRARARADEGAASRAAVGGRGTGARGVREGRRQSDRHRRQRRARLPAAPPARRGDAARRGGRARGGPGDRRRDGARLGRAGRRGDHQDRQREHGRRPPGRLRPAGPRPARVRARRLRRRGPAARERDGEADGLVPGGRPAGARAPVRDRRPRRRLPRRVRPDVHQARGRGRPGGRGHDPRRPGRARGGMARGGGDRARVARHLLRRRHALPPAGLRDPGRGRPRRGTLGRARQPRGALQRPARAAVRLPHAGYRVGDRQPAGRGLRSSAQARAAGRRAR